MAYCRFELCRDCGLGCFSELLLADIRRLSVVARGGGVLVSNNCFFYNKTQQHHFWNFILMTQCKLCIRAGGGGGSQQREVADGADGADVVFTDTGGSICPQDTRMAISVQRVIRSTLRLVLG